MMELILLVTLGALPQPVQVAGPFRPCVWPNRCAPQARVEVAGFKPCVWPNRCGGAPTLAALPVTTCQWPNRCRVEVDATL